MATASTTPTHQQILILKGGIESWRALGYPLEGEFVDIAGDAETHLLLQDGKYRIDTDQSIIEWVGRNPNTKHFGTVRILDGQIQIEDKTITGVAEIDLNSIENMNLEGDGLQSVLVSHLKSEDFFIEANAQFLSQLSLEESQTFHAYKCPSKSLCLGRKEIIHHPPRDWREYMKKILSDFGKARAREELKKN